MKLSTEDKDDIYVPAEDTYLLMKAAEALAKPSDSVLEVGCGRGVISRHLAARVRSILATDINPHAAKSVLESGIDAIRADIFSGIKGRFDLIIFNPPYLPTCEDEKIVGWMNLALDGGVSGRETINRFLADLGSHLTPGGRALLLLSSLTGLEEVKEIAQAVGLDVDEVAAERHFFEELYVLELSESKPALD